MKKLFTLFSTKNSSLETSSKSTKTKETTELVRVKQLKDEIHAIRIKNQPFSLSSLLHILTNKLAHLLKENANSIYYDVDNNVGRYIIGDNEYIEQVLYVLLQEAILLYTNSEIVLKVSKNENAHLLFEVMNAKAIIQKDIYDEYTKSYHIKSSQSEKLNTFVKAKMIVESMSGTLEISSTKKTGTCFRFNIPYIEDKDDRSHQEELKKCLAGKYALFIGRNAYDTQRTQYIFETYGIHIHNMKLDDFEKKKPSLNAYNMAIIRSEDLSYKHISFFKNIVQDERNDFKIIIIHELFEDKINIERSKPIAHAELFSPIVIGDVEEILYQLFILESKAVKGINNIEIFDPDSFIIKGQDTLLEENLEQYQGANIAIVEDSKIDKKILQNILMQEGITLFCMHNGSEMLDLLEYEEIDIIFADINMPVMDGILMTKKIRMVSKWNHIPIISIFSMAFPHELKKMELAGMNAAITKPIEAKDIYMALKSFLKVTEKMKTRKKHKNTIHFSFNEEVLNISKKIQLLDNKEEYFETLLKKIEQARESRTLFESMIYEEKLLALEEYVKSILLIYEEISAPNMIRMFKELNYFISQEDRTRLFDYISIYRKNWEELEVELEKYTSTFQ